VKTAIAITGLAIVGGNRTFPIVTNDKLLVAIFGGFFLVANWLAVREGVYWMVPKCSHFYEQEIGMTMGDCDPCI